jgi:hypothetical protein
MLEMFYPDSATPSIPGVGSLKVPDALKVFNKIMDLIPDVFDEGKRRRTKLESFPKHKDLFTRNYNFVFGNKVQPIKTHQPKELKEAITARAHKLPADGDGRIRYSSKGYKFANAPGLGNQVPSDGSSFRRPKMREHIMQYIANGGHKSPVCFLLFFFFFFLYFVFA